MSYTESKGPAVHVTESNREWPSKFDLVMAGMTVNMVVVYAGGMIFDVHYAAKNKPVIERSVAEDGMRVKEFSFRGNGIAIGKTAQGMTLELDGCAIEGVKAHLTRGKGNAITDTSHYEFSVQSQEASAGSAQAPETTVTQETIYRFEDAAGLRAQLGDQPWTVCKPN